MAGLPKSCRYANWSQNWGVIHNMQQLVGVIEEEEEEDAVHILCLVCVCVCVCLCV